MKTNHSKLPFHVEPPAFGEGFNIEDAEGHGVATEGAFSCISKKEDADFIVRATSNFYPLLEACKKFLAIGNPMRMTQEEYIERYSAAQEAILEAVKNAEGGES